MGGDEFLAGRRCLVLDDEYLIALDIQQILESAGADGVICVSTAREALDAIAGGAPFDVAVLDVKLDDKAGDSLEVAAALGRTGTPFLFLTGYDRATLPERFRSVPRLTKPFSTGAVLREIGQLVVD